MHILLYIIVAALLPQCVFSSVTVSSRTNSSITFEFTSAYSVAYILVDGVFSQTKSAVSNGDEFTISNLQTQVYTIGIDDTSSVTTVEACPLPENPPSIVSSALSNESVLVNFTLPHWGLINGSELSYRLPDKTEIEHFNLTATERSHIYSTNLEQDSQYEVCVRTMIDCVGEILYSFKNCDSFYTDPSSQPFQVDRYNDAPTTTFNITPDAQPNNQILVVAVDGVKVNLVNSNLVTDLTPGTSYNITLKMKSSLSNQVSTATLVHQCTRSEPFTSATFTDSEYDRVTLHFQYPENGRFDTWFSNDTLTGNGEESDLNFTYGALSSATTYTYNVYTQMDCTLTGEIIVSAPFTATAKTAPDMPVIDEQNQLSYIRNGFNLQLSVTSSDITNPDVTYVCDVNGTLVSTTIEENNNLQSFTNLLPGTLYGIKCRGIYDGIPGNYSETITRCTNPMPPNGLERDLVNLTFTDSITIEYAPPEIGGYTYFDIFSSASYLNAENTTEFQYTIQGLAPANTYVYFVTTQYTCHHGDVESEPAMITVNTAPKKPDLFVEPVDDTFTKVKVTCSPTGVNELELTYRFYQDGVLFAAQVAPVLQVDGLNPCQKYIFTCDIERENIVSEESYQYNVTTNPASPRLLSDVERINSTRLKLCWELPLQGSADFYNLKINDVEINSRIEGDNNDYCHVFASLEPKTVYSLTARSVCEVINDTTTNLHYSEYAEALVAVTGVPKPNITITVINTTSLQLESSEPGDLYRYYRDDFEFTTLDRVHILTGLAPGGTYTFNLSVKFEDTESVISDAFSACTEPGPPTNLEVICITGGSAPETRINVTWGYPTEGNLTFWQIKIGSTESYALLLPTTKFHSFDGLELDTSYDIYLRAVTVDRITPSVCFGEDTVVSYSTDPASLLLSSKAMTNKSIEVKYNAWEIGMTCEILRNDEKLTSSMLETYTDTELVPGTWYTYSISCSRFACYNIYATLIECTLPGVIPLIEQINQTDQTIWLSWSVPLGNYTGFIFRLDQDSPVDIGDITEYSFNYPYSAASTTVCIKPYLHCVESQTYTDEETCIILHSAPTKPSVKACAVDEQSIQIFPTVAFEGDPNNLFYNAFASNEHVGPIAEGSFGLAENLSPGAKYNISAIAEYHGHDSVSSDIIEICTYPAKPGNLIAIDVVGGVFLEWSYPGVGETVKFQVKIDTLDWISTDHPTNHTVNLPTTGVNHIFRVRTDSNCYACNLEQPVFAVSEYSTVSKCTRPLPLTIFAAFTYSKTNTTIYWDTTLVHCQKIIVFRDEVEIATVEHLGIYVDSGLRAGTIYSYTFACEVCDDPVRSFSNVLQACTLPEIPESCLVFPENSTSVSAKWTYPTIGIATNFLVSITGSNPTLDLFLNTEEYIFNALIPATENFLCVKSVFSCPSGQSMISLCQECSGYTAPSTPVIVPTSIDKDTIQLGIEDNNGAASYLFYRDLVDIDVLPSKADAPLNDDGLHCGTEYSYFAYAEASTHRSPSDFVSQCTYPDLATLPVASTINDSAFFLSWQRPACGDYTEFQIKIGEEVPVTTASLNYTFTGRPPASQFPLKIATVKHCNATGQDIISEFMEVATPAYTAPLVPTITELKAASENEIGITFPEADVGITHQLYRDGILLHVSAIPVYIDNSGLQPSTQYNYSMTATKFGITSAFSENSSICTKPVIPTSVNAIATSSSSVKLMWSPPSAGITTSYIVQVSNHPEISVSNATEYEFLNLDNSATCYAFRVKAVLDCPNTDLQYESNFTEAIIQCTKPATPIITDHFVYSSSQLSIDFTSVDPQSLIKFTLSLNGTATQMANSPQDSKNLIGGTLYCYELYTTAHELDSDVSAKYCACTKPDTPIITLRRPSSTEFVFDFEMTGRFDYVTFNNTQNFTNAFNSVNSSDLVPATCYALLLPITAYVTCNETKDGNVLISSETASFDEIFCTAPNSPELTNQADVSGSAFQVFFTMNGTCEHFVIELDPNPGYTIVIPECTFENVQILENLTSSRYDFAIYAVVNDVRSIPATGTYAFEEEWLIAGIPGLLFIGLVVAAVAVAVVVVAVVVFVVIKLFAASGSSAAGAAANSADKGRLWSDPGADAKIKSNLTDKIRSEYIAKNFKGPGAAPV